MVFFLKILKGPKMGRAAPTFSAGHGIRTCPAGAHKLLRIVHICLASKNPACRWPPANMCARDHCELYTSCSISLGVKNGQAGCDSSVRCDADKVISLAGQADLQLSVRSRSSWQDRCRTKGFRCGDPGTLQCTCTDGLTKSTDSCRGPDLWSP